MADLVVTVPADRWAAWLKEGDLAGKKATGRLYEFALGTNKPDAKPGDRVYVLAHRRLRGYAPLVAIKKRGRQFYAIRAGGAVACTLPRALRGYRGFAYRSWERQEERPFPEWSHVSGELAGIERVIKQLRVGLGLTRPVLAERTDWSVSRIGFIEAGTVGVVPEDLPWLAEAFRVRKESLYAALSGLPIADLVREAQTVAPRQAGAGHEGRGDRPGLLGGPVGSGDGPGDGGRPADPLRGDAGGEPGRVPGHGPAGALPGPVPADPPVTIRHGIRMIWSVKGSRLHLEAKNGHREMTVGIALRSDPVAQRRLQDDAERLAVHALTGTK